MCHNSRWNGRFLCSFVLFVFKKNESQMFCYTCYICNTCFHSSQKLCFSPLKALLPDSKSIAFRLSEQCSWPPKAMLLASESNALGVTEQCSGGYRAMFCMVRSSALDGTELCSVRYGAMLCKVWSSALDGHMRCRRWWNDLYQQKAPCTTRRLDRGHALLKPIYLFFERSDGGAVVISQPPCESRHCSGRQFKRRTKGLNQHHKTIGGQPIGATHLFYFYAHVCVYYAHTCEAWRVVGTITQQPLPWSYDPSHDKR